MTEPEPMERRRLGNSGLESAVVGMGTWPDLRRTGRQGRMYGEAERVLGQSVTAVRDRVLVATKGVVGGRPYCRSPDLGCLGVLRKAGRPLSGHNLVSTPRRLEMLEDLKADGRVGAIYWSCRPFGEGDPLRRPPVPADLASLAEFGVKTWPQALLKWVLSDWRCHVAVPATSSPTIWPGTSPPGSRPWLGPEERDLVARLAEGR